MRGKVLLRVALALTAIGFVASTAWSAQSKTVVRQAISQSQVDVPLSQVAQPERVTATEAFCTTSGIAGILGSASTTGTQTGRLFRDGIPSTCAVPKTCVTFDAVPGRTYDAYTIPNTTGAARCVTVTLSTTAGCGSGSGMFAVAYLSTFNPASICTNYLADAGFSAIASTVSFAFSLPAGASAVIVVHEVDPGTQTACPYTLTVADDTCTPIPTLGSWGLVALGLLLVGAAFLILRFRS